jgi:LysR family transcriptional regulator, hydrogen peroxide-inducible genes activator
MNLQQLEYIIALDKYKSFGKAAESCFITQATLSTMVKKLEEELELVLFDRKTSPIITTECGKEIVQEAQKIVGHSYRLKQIASSIKGIVEGELRIGVIPTVAGNLLHRILPKLLEKYPNLTLTLEEITTENIIQKLKNGELDAGLLSTPLKNNDLEETILYYEKLMVYGSVEQLNTQFVSPKDIQNEKIWLLETGNCLTNQIINVCALNTKKINNHLNFQPNSFESLLNIVDSLHGLTLIPELYYADLSENRKKRVREFTPPYPVREISLVYNRPYAKIKLIEAVTEEIINIISPQLMTHQLKNSEMMIAKI